MTPRSLLDRLHGLRGSAAAMTAPMLLMVGVFVALGASEGGFFPASWLPAALLASLLLATALLTAATRAVVLGAYAIGAAGLGLVTAIRLMGAADPSTFLVAGRLLEPVGYVNGNAGGP